MPYRCMVSSNLIQTIIKLQTAESTQKSTNTSRNEFAFAPPDLKTTQTTKCWTRFLSLTGGSWYYQEAWRRQ